MIISHCKSMPSEVSAYLKDPHSCGLYELELIWVEDGGISNDLWELYEKQNTIIPDLTSDKNLVEHVAMYEEIHMKISPLGTILKSLTIVDQGEFDLALKKDGYGVITLLRDVATRSAIKKKYADAIAHYNAAIAANEDEFVFKINDITYINGNYLKFINGPRDSESIKIAGLKKSILEDIGGLYMKAGKALSYTVRRLFSPDVELYVMYWPLIIEWHGSYYSERKYKRNFEKIYDELSEQKFGNVITDLGLISEDYFTEMYETLFREECPKRLTLGQKVDQIVSKTRDIVTTPVRDVVWSDLFAIINTTNCDHESIRHSMREIVKATKASRDYQDRKLKHHNSLNWENSVFPSPVSESIDEFIRIRNSAAHKSRYPVGEYEAIRAIVSLTKIINWWKQCKVSIDFDKTHQEVLQELIGRVRGMV